MTRQFHRPARLDPEAAESIEVVDRARDFGRRTPPRATRREAASSLAPAFPTAELTRFAAAVDGQVFGKGVPTSYAVSTIWASADALFVLTAYEVGTPLPMT